MGAVDLSQQVHQIADQLPPEATWDDVIETARTSISQAQCSQPCVNLTERVLLP